MTTNTAPEGALPLVELDECAGVFLPVQEDVFPDEDDFGRIFRNNAVISAAGMIDEGPWAAGF